MSNLDEVRINTLAKLKQALLDDPSAQRAVMPFVKLALIDQQAVFDAILLQRQDAAAQLESVRRELVAAIDERNAADRACAHLEQDLSDARAACAGLRDELESAQVQLLAMDADNARLTQELHRLRSWITDADARALSAQNSVRIEVAA